MLIIMQFLWSGCIFHRSSLCRDSKMPKQCIQRKKKKHLSARLSDVLTCLNYAITVLILSAFKWLKVAFYGSVGLNDHVSPCLILLWHTYLPIKSIECFLANFSPSFLSTSRSSWKQKQTSDVILSTWNTKCVKLAGGTDSPYQFCSQQAFLRCRYVLCRFPVRSASFQA